MSNQRKNLRSTPSHNLSESYLEDGGKESNPFASSNEEGHIRTRRSQRICNHSLDFKVEIPEFEGRLDLDEFLQWLQTVEIVFEYNDVPEDNKVKLVALKLRKYASLWWENLIKKRAKRGKAKIRSWEKMRTKLKDRFLPPSYLQDNYSKLHHLQQGSLSVEEYTREFEKLLIKCDIQESEDQTIVRYLSGLDTRYAHVVELQQYSSFDDVCVLAHRVQQQRKSKLLKKDPQTSFTQELTLQQGEFPTLS